MNLTDEQIIKALECCYKDGCKECPLWECKGDCFEELIKDNVLDLINRQKAEIERYKHSIKLLEKDVADAKADTVKDFARFVIDKSVKGVVYALDIVDYVPEFLGR